MIWVAGKSGLLSFDPRKPKHGWLPFPVDGQYPGGAVSFLTLSSNGHVLLALQSGGLYEVNVDAKDVPIVKQVITEGLPKYPLNALYTDRAGRIWVAVNNKLYRQDKQQSVWQSLTPMPYGNHDLFGVELNGKIYTAGGGAYHGFTVVSKNFDCLLIYDIKNDRWEISPPMSTNHRYCSVGLLEGKIWVIGGFNKSDKIPEKEGRMWNDSPINTVEIYDPVQRSWTAGPSLDVPRAETVACTMAGRLYVFGSTGNEIFKTLSIGPGEKQWRTEPAAPYPVFQTTGCVLDNKAYIMAGGNGLLIYDPETQTWQKDLPLIPGSKPPFSSIVVTFRKEIWVISGRGNDDGTKTWIYSPQEKKWRVGPPFPYPTMWANGIEVNGRLYIYGGATMSKIRNTYLYWDAIRVLNN
jgi:N-acetylneuraminic acid mutarotase